MKKFDYRQYLAEGWMFREKPTVQEADEDREWIKVDIGSREPQEVTLFFNENGDIKFNYETDKPYFDKVVDDETLRRVKTLSDNTPEEIKRFNKEIVNWGAYEEFLNSCTGYDDFMRRFSEESEAFTDNYEGNDE